MYESYFKLKKKPFQISSDPGFMWLGEKHKEALAILKYGIMDNKGFLLLTGDVGTGKTTLINALIESLSEDVILTSITDPSLEKLDFLNYIGASFGINKEFTSKGIFLAYFRRFLLAAHKEGKKVLLIIDESQLLSQEMLEEIRLLSNIEKTDVKLINIFFIGQNEFNEILNMEQNRAVRQRLTLNYNLDPLAPSEVDKYIKYRMKIAGAREEFFTPSAVNEIFTYSGGFPRRINVLCDHCLLSAFVKEQKVVDDRTVRMCAKDLKIPEYVANRDVDGYGDPDSTPFTKSSDDNNSKSGGVQKKTTQPHPLEWLPFFRGKDIRLLYGFFICIAALAALWFFYFQTNLTGSLGFHHRPVDSTEIAYNDPPLSDYDQTPDQKYPEHSIPDHSVADRSSDELTSSDPGSIDDKAKIEDLQEKPLIPSEDSTPDAIPEELMDTNNQELLALSTEKIVVRFKHDTTDINDEGILKLNEFAEVIKKYPDLRLLISGYTDTIGGESYNKKISEFRANIVKSFFLGKGLNSDRITVVGLGGHNPIHTNDSAWGRMMNRRVEIEVIE